VVTWPSLFLFSLRFFKKTGKGIELLFPELPVTLDPFGGILHGFGDETAVVDSSILAAHDKPGLLQHPQVLRYGRERHVERGSQVANGGFTLRQARQDTASGSVGKRAEGGIEIGPGILNHVV
jgi:hypothetical protein